MTDEQPLLTPIQIKDIRIKLGWSFEDMADALLLSEANGANVIRRFEAKPMSARHRPITGPAAVALMAFVDGFDTPPVEDWQGIIEDFLK